MGKNTIDAMTKEIVSVQPKQLKDEDENECYVDDKEGSNKNNANHHI